ncbi:MAG: GNAT family N-acetyltransferase [Clostridiaceae bacterium]|nr:GNAT family N-acetyltransferase [Clostridiaceae bacterium]
MFKTERLHIIKADLKYLNDYYKEFTAEICQYQYPDPFKSLADAKELLEYFMGEMNEGNMIELMILDQNQEFIGSMEAFGFKEEALEVGLWLKSSVHGKGYGYEALKALVDYLKEKYPQKDIIYEVDERNTASIALVKKFPYTVKEANDFITESGKKLRLVPYLIG